MFKTCFINKRTVVSVLCFSLALNLFGVNYYCFWIPFSDKDNATYKINSPSEFLSDNALKRRLNQNININKTDLPVNKEYIDQIAELGLNIQYSLKWFNGVVTYTADSALIEKTKLLSFVQTPILIGLFDNQTKSLKNKFDEDWMKSEEFQDGFTQINLENGFFLHNNDYKGESMTIAILDAGFENANSVPALENVWNNNQVLSTKDFSTNPSSIFESHQHGTNVFSIIAGNYTDFLIGTAPNANYHLLRSEVVAYEQPIEMYNWAAAAEYADSVGADIINSSLAYGEFDKPFDSFTYEDMDGNTSIIANAALMATRKGILVVNSAGNEGNKEWRYIVTPSDADSILGAGATDAFGNKALFSSRGPSSDNRIKPDISAMGQTVCFQRSNGNISYGNGTSFSAPIISGLAACLWQAFPQAGNQEIRKAIINSASLYFTPDNDLGYGIPDFEIAYNLLKTIDKNITITNLKYTLVQNKLDIEIFSPVIQNCKISIYSVQPHLYYEENIEIDILKNEKEVNVSQLGSGIYFLSLQLNNKIENHRFIKL